MSRLGLPEDSTPAYIWQYYERSQAALRALRREIESDPSTVGPFGGMTVAELEDALVDVRNELDRQVTLALVASFEGLIRVDYVDRVSRRLKDEASRELRELHRACRKRRGRRRPRLDEVLEAWRRVSGRSQVVDRFKQLLRLRHWLAHGRYWVQKSGILPDPHLAWGIADALFRSLPGFGSLAAA